MEVFKIQERIIKCKIKCKKRIATTEKLRKRMNKKNLEGLSEKEIDERKNQLIEKGTNRTRKENEELDNLFDVSLLFESIRESEKKHRELQLTLENWENKLIAEQQKLGIVESAPKIILDFMEGWKQRAYEYQLELLKRYTTMIDSKDYKEADYKKQCEMKQCFTELTISLYDKPKAQREKWLSEVLEREKNIKILDLLIRVNGIVGTIVDASNLSIGYKGDIVGTIVGDKGKCRIETIGAGGYNIQCYHFRTLINKID